MAGFLDDDGSDEQQCRCHNQHDLSGHAFMFVMVLMLMMMVVFMLMMMVFVVMLAALMLMFVVLAAFVIVMMMGMCHNFLNFSTKLWRICCNQVAKSFFCVFNS